MKPFVSDRRVETKGDRMVANACIDGRWYSCEAKYDPNQYARACRFMDNMINELARNVGQYGHVPAGRTATEFYEKCRSGEITVERNEDGSVSVTEHAV